MFAQTDAQLLEWLEAQCEQSLRPEVAKLNAVSPPEKLHHYTSLSTFEKILENHCLWATEGFYMNDHMELRHTAALLLDAIAKVEDEFTTRTRDPSFFSYVRNFVRTDAENRRTFLFLASFSERDDTLSQWRAYADDAAGVAITFDLRGLGAQHHAGLASGLGRPLLVKCDYDEHAQREVVERIVRNIAEAVSSHPDYDQRRHVLKKRMGALMVSVSQELSPFFKNPGFVEEAEWRMVVRDHSEGASEFIKFRETKRGPVPYVRIPIGGLAGSPVTGLRLGPRVDPTMQRVARLLLDRKKLQSVKILRASASYIGNR